MASVEELILAAKSKQKQSPLSALAELIKVGASGYAEGQKQRQTADLSRVEIARKMIELQQIQEDMKAQEENRKFFKDQMDAESELRVRNNLASTAGTPAATTPRNKVQKEFSLDSKGRLSGAVKIVPTPTPTSLDELVTEKVRNGELSIEDAYRMKQPGAMGGGKPPTGFRWTPDGNLEIIPGGPANIKAEAERARTEAARRQLSDEATLVVNKIDSALKNVNAFSAGWGSFSKGIPGSPAMNLKADLDTIKSSLGLGKLMEMKNNSKAGASGLGQLSDKEMTLLTSAIASLEQAQTPGQLQEKLGEVKTHYQNILQMNEGINPFESGTTPNAQTPGASSGSALPSGKIRVKRTTDGKTGTINEADFDPSKYQRLP